MDELFGEVTFAPLLLFPVQLVDQVDGVEEPHSLALMDGRDPKAVARWV